MRDHVKGECQRCGFDYLLSQLRKEPKTGFMVCKGPNTNDCWDARHPQEFVRAVQDKQSVRNPAPEPEDYFLSINEVQPEDL